MAEMAKRVRHLICKDGRFYFRRRVPDELQERFGRKEVSEALGDVSKAQAVAKVNELAALWDRNFLAARHALGLAPNPAVPAGALKAPRRVATRDDVELLAAVAAREVLARDEEARRRGIYSDSGDHWTSELTDLGDAVGPAVAGTGLAGVWQHLRPALHARALDLPDDPEERRTLAYAWAQHLAKALQAVQARSRGEAVDTPPPVPVAARKWMRDAFKAWKELNPTRPQKTVGAFERHLAMFEEMTGNPPLHQLQRSHCTGFRDKLQAWAIEQRKAARTADNVLVSLRALAEVARDPDRAWIVGDNPFRKLTILVSGKEVEERQAWSEKDLVVLFGAPLFTRYELPDETKAGGPAAYWLPLLGAFCGARVSELCQLWTDDLSEEQDEEGRPVLVVEFREGPGRGQKLKGGPKGPSWRAIPIHSELIRLGFRDYWEATKRAHGDAPGPLFPQLPREGQNGAGGQFSHWFGSFKASLGFTSAHGFHSFRHTFITELTVLGTDGDLRRAITGHAQQDVHGKGYGKGVRRLAVRLVPTMERLRFPRLDLPRVYPASATVEPAWEGGAVAQAA